jgi:hypothetical protein
MQVISFEVPISLIAGKDFLLLNEYDAGCASEQV